MKLHNEELHDLCCSPDIVSDQMVGHVARTKKKKNAYGLGGGGGDLNGRNHLEDLDLEM
jgi:hypothetical protein